MRFYAYIICRGGFHCLNFSCLNCASKSKPSINNIHQRTGLKNSSAKKIVQFPSPRSPPVPSLSLCFALFRVPLRTALGDRKEQPPFASLSLSHNLSPSPLSHVSSDETLDSEEEIWRRTVRSFEEEAFPPPCEREIREASLSRSLLPSDLDLYPGLQTLKLLRRGGMPVAFADFQDIESSTEALNGLQGTYLPSSDRDVIHVEYARSKMRRT